MATTFDIIILVSCVCLFSLGYTLDIDIKPYKLNSLIPQDVNIMCKLDNSDYDVKEIMILELSKDDVPVAVIRFNSELSYGENVDSRITAEGTISKTAVYNSYLHVTLETPTVKDAGKYTCLVYFLDHASVLREIKRSTNLTVTDPDLTSAVKYLMGKVSDLEDKDFQHEMLLNLTSNHNATVDQLTEELARQKTELDKQDTDHIIQINQLKQELTTQKSILNTKTSKLETELSAQNTKTSELETELSAQKTQTDQLKTQNLQLSQQQNELIKKETQLQNQITQLTNQNTALKRELDETVSHLNDKDSKILNTVSQLQETTRTFGHTIGENTTILFLATRPAHGVFTDGGDVIFNHVLTNKGGGYSGPTGVFTAPVRGIYLFTLSVCAHHGKQIFLDLRTNTGQVLTRLYAYNKDYLDYSESTGMVELDVGQTIRPVIRSVFSVFSLYQADNPDLMNKFSGLLIKML